MDADKDGGLTTFFIRTELQVMIVNLSNVEEGLLFFTQTQREVSNKAW